jgi:hypothetical protein
MDPSKPSKPPNISTSPTPMSPTSPLTTSPPPTSPSSASSIQISKIPFPQLKEKVLSALNARNNGYAAATALIAYWEDDDTGAEKDANHLEKTFKNLQLDDEYRSIEEGFEGTDILRYAHRLHLMEMITPEQARLTVSDNIQMAST